MRWVLRRTTATGRRLPKRCQVTAVQIMTRPAVELELQTQPEAYLMPSDVSLLSRISGDCACHDRVATRVRLRRELGSYQLVGSRSRSLEHRARRDSPCRGQVAPRWHLGISFLPGLHSTQRIKRHGYQTLCGKPLVPHNERGAT